MPTSSRHGLLAGKGVVVTRPEHQADNLCRLIESEGAKALRFPVLEIVDTKNMAALNAIIARLEQFDIAIFISPNAVTKAANLIHAQRNWPENLKIAAVGRASAKALDKVNLATDIFPKTRFNSEALLELEEMQDVAGKKIVIFRGEGGREVLAETLKLRGAIVEYAECYRRSKPETDTSQLMKAWARGEIDIVTVTSNEGLANLFDMLGQLGRNWLQKTPLVVVSERGAEFARELGFKSEIIISEQASDESLLDAIKQWRQTHMQASTG